MNTRTFIVVDRDFISRNKLVRTLSHKGYVIPLDRMEELGGQWPDDAWVFDRACDLGLAFQLAITTESSARLPLSASAETTP